MTAHSKPARRSSCATLYTPNVLVIKTGSLASANRMILGLVLSNTENWGLNNYLVMAGPERIELPPLVSKTSMISISPRADKYLYD